MISRRQFGFGAAAAAITASGACSKAGDVSMKSVQRVGLQTYTLREVMRRSPLEMFQMIKAAGYDFVELNGGDFQKANAQDISDMLAQTGLYAPASHISIEALRENLTPLVQGAKILDLEYLVVPWIGDHERSLEDWKRHAATMNAAGQSLAGEGIKLAYHNHQFEFDDLGGGTNAMDVLLAESALENLALELDFFWAYLGDADIPAMFRAHPGRFKLCHIKDMKANKADFAEASYEAIGSDLMVNVGEGVIPFETYLALNDISGMEYFIAEHDSPKQPYLDAIKISHDAVRGFRF